jgi:hypothetical protein
MSKSDDLELLEELRHFSGWRWCYPDLDGLAQQALKMSRLQTAFEAAHARWSAGRSESSNSSQVFVEFQL